MKHSAEWLRGEKAALRRLKPEAWKPPGKRLSQADLRFCVDGDYERVCALLAAAEAREAGEPKGIAAWLTDNHVRTKDGKLCCVEVRRPDTHGGMACTWKMKDFDIQAEMDGCEVGEEIVLRYVELTDAEFTALGDFDGW